MQVAHLLSQPAVRGKSAAAGKTRFDSALIQHLLDLCCRSLLCALYDLSYCIKYLTASSVVEESMLTPTTALNQHYLQGVYF